MPNNMIRPHDGIHPLQSVHKALIGDDYSHRIGCNKHAVSYIDAYGQRWIACPDCIDIQKCDIGRRVLAGHDEEYGCSIGVPAPGKEPKRGDS